MRKNFLMKVMRGISLTVLTLAVSVTGLPFVEGIDTVTNISKVAEAATVTSRLPMVAYTRYSSGNLTTYSDRNLTNPTGYICDYDQCTILQMYSNGAVYVRYPVRNGTRTAFAPMSGFFGDIDFSTATARMGIQKTVYRKSSGNATIGTAFASDSVNIVALDVSNRRTQIIYPIANGYKLGWIDGLYRIADNSQNNNQNNNDGFAALRAKYPSNSLWNGSYQGRAWQCHGFALTLGYERTGTDPYNWSKVYHLNSLKPGDIIRCTRPHTIMVTGVSGNTITYVDCNWVGKNKVRWDQTISRQNITSKFGKLSYVLVSPK